MNVQALGWTLVHFVWQGAAAAALLASLNLLFRRAAPQVRYLLAAATLVVMVLAPAATFRLLRTSPAPAPDHPEAAAVAPTAEAAPAGPGLAALGVESPLAAEPLRSRIEPALPMLVGLWGAGVLLFSLRSLGGWAVAQRLRRAGLRAVPAAVQEALDRLVEALRVSAPVRLFESALVEVPTVLGWLRPTILVPASALSGLSPQQLELILAHELAHVRRYDYLVNLLQTAAEAVLFYHPAVWWVSQRMRVEREHCCDDLAVAACGNAVVYARALADLEDRRSGAPVLAMAASGGSLLARVTRLLGPPPHLSRSSRGLAAVLAVGALAVAGNAGTFLFASQTPPPEEVQWAQAAEARTDAQPAEAEPEPEARPQPAADPRPQAEPRPDPAAQPQANPQPAARAFPLDQILEMANQGIRPEWIDEMDALGYRSLTAAQLVELRSHGVGPEYIRGMTAEGYRDLSAERLVALRSQGVTPEFARELKAQGLAGLSVSDLINLRSQGVSPEFVKEMKEAGYDDLSVSRLMALRSQGVSGAYAAELKALGYANLSANKLMALRSQGITPAYVRGLGDLGYRDIALPMLLALRSQGVTPEYVRELQKAGLQELPLGALIELRSQGVTGEYVEELKQAGYDQLTPSQLVEMRAQGLTGSWLKRLRNQK